MGIINVGTESFYSGSVRSSPGTVAKLAAEMVQGGADLIDIGAMSTSPSHFMDVPPEAEVRRLTTAVRAASEKVDVPISVDTPRAMSANAALDAGATVVNDVSGLSDDRMAEVIVRHDASAILMANERSPRRGPMMNRIAGALRTSISSALDAGIPKENIVVDPGFGFFRRHGKGFGFELTDTVPWYVWDCLVLRDLQKLRRLRRPVCISVSRKGFFREVLGLDNPGDRLIGSLAASAIAAYNGADLVRTHDVEATLQAVKVAERIREGGRRKGPHPRAVSS